MEKLRFPLFLFALAAGAVLALSCGSSTSISGQIRQPQSITLSPATADAQNYPNGQVQFIVTAHYNTAPDTITPQSATWGACYQNAPSTAVSVSNEGLAQCANGASGTYTIFAFDMTNCNVITACGGGCTVVGTAQLTCP
jgi:hypothetical protein